MKKLFIVKMKQKKLREKKIFSLFNEIIYVHSELLFIIKYYKLM